MFDDEQKEPNDIFAETDKTAPQVTPPTASPQQAAPSAEVPAAQAAPQAPAPQAQAPAPHESLDDRLNDLQVAKKGIPWKPILLVIAILVVIVGAFLVSMRVLNSRTPTTPKAPDTTQEDTKKTSANTGQKTQVDPTADSDKDGLTDVREKELGTDPSKEDTDADGLFDREEVEVYKTNPLKADTDGDTFLDGAEVEAGYNPNGDGKLLNLPK